MGKNDYNKEHHKIITKRIDNYALYAYYDVLDDIRYQIDGLLSPKSRDLFLQLTTGIYDEIGHLQCNELTDCYIIEEGFNFDD